jgi:succinylglutamate desuccinylase
MKAIMELNVSPKVQEGDHLISAVAGDAAGPTLIVVGGIHGNEPAGVEALQQIAEVLPGLADHLYGRVYLIAGNTRAMRKHVRFIDRDLNRAWTRNNLGVVGAQRQPHVSECREVAEIDHLLDSILITARSEVYVVDLHSTSAGGVPFATVGDTLRNRTFARKFPVTILLGVEEQLEGTMLEYLNNAGAVTLGFEGGQHLSDETVENHKALVWLAMLNAGMLAKKDIPDHETFRSRLAAGKRAPRVVEVRHREAITAADKFEMVPGFNNFDPIAKGQVLANSSSGPIRAAEKGLVLMPLYQKLGEDGFFIGRTVAPFWLWLSATLRRLKIQEIIHWLPGVVRNPDDHESLIVNTRMARFFPLQVFHLLGFRRRRWNGSDLVVSRRRHDTVSPFDKEGE